MDSSRRLPSSPYLPLALEVPKRRLSRVCEHCATSTESTLSAYYATWTPRLVLVGLLAL